jgi:23S rRNA (pseudouridine1915-N3)-methyltransferase
MFFHIFAFMKLTLLFCGKTREKHISEGMQEYLKRIKHYFKIEVIESADIKSISDPELQKEAEAEKLLKHINPCDFLVLLDEKGKEFTSRQFASFIEKKSVAGVRNIVFTVAGAYGAHSKLLERVNTKISLSKMTFPHQLVRLIFAEQLYRACSIIRKEPYHHD